MAAARARPREPVDAAAQRKVVALLGLGARGRQVVVGVEQVRAAAHRGRLKLVVLAPDASRHSRDKVLALLQAKRVSVLDGPDAAELGAAVGRSGTAAVGIIDPALADGIRAAASVAARGE